MVEYEKYKPKKILNIGKHIDGGWFWTKYSAHPYIGCQYGCQYCYVWGTKYSSYPNNYQKFCSLIKVKENAPELLKKELKKVPVDLIAVGDWQPAEQEFHLSRKMLEVCLELGFPVLLLEKSPLVVQDLDLIKKINEKSEAIVAFSIITTKDDRIREIFEPNTPSAKARFSAMAEIAKAGITTGISMMPILPYIYDNDENLEGVIAATKKAGGKFVLASSLTLEQGSFLKKSFLEIIKNNFVDLYPKYVNLFQDSQGKELYGPRPEYWRSVGPKIALFCTKYGIMPYIPRPVKYWPKSLKINKEIAADFYLKAREFEYDLKNRYKVWAYRKAAWALDELDRGVDEIYKKSWLTGLQKIEGVGNRLAHAIENELKH